MDADRGEVFMKKQKVMLLVNDTAYAYNLCKEVIEKIVAEGDEGALVVLGSFCRKN